MSTLSQPTVTPQWKEEVNRRIAAHKNRKNGSAQATPAQQTAATSRAAEAAARVAARYAKAPSYSQMQAEEARAAVRAAEIATKVALEAQAAAESALAGLHAASIERAHGPAVVENIAQAQRKLETHADPREQAGEGAGEEQARQTAIPAPPGEPAPPPVVEPRYQQPLAVRWDPDMPARSADRRAATRPQEPFELAAEDWWSPAEIGSVLRNEPVEVPGTASSQANLIQFPRELIATRKIRPRLAETYAGTISEAEGQLSIFEVDPRSITTGAQLPVDLRDPNALDGASAVQGPEWSGIQLDAHPALGRAAAPATERRSIAYLAPLGLRLMATVIDCALILASFVLVGFVAAGIVHHPPVGKAALLLGAASFAGIGLLYYAVFLCLGICTPGMKYAGIGLCTFDDESPTRAQLQRRLGAMALSLVPVGLGVVWAVFDDDHLCWHDRISQTYLRKL